MTVPWQEKPLAPATGTGECPDEKDARIIDLQSQLVNLQAERDQLLDQVSDLRSKLGNGDNVQDEQKDEGGESFDLTDAAVKKRLMRMVGKPGIFGSILHRSY